MSTPWIATVLTIFPEMFPGPLALSLSGKALEKGLWRLDAVNLRDFATDRHQSVDDTPMGGGAGMVIRPDVVARAVAAVRARGAVGPLVYLTPRGFRMTQEEIDALAREPGVVLLCGRYEGVDQRVIEALGFREYSVADFVMSGGEIPAMAVIDACVRLLPGVVGDAASLEEESFRNGLLEYPQYTRPQVWEGIPVPEVLVSGDHAAIRRWRRRRALETTRERRPELLLEHFSRDP